MVVRLEGQLKRWMAVSSDKEQRELDFRYGIKIVYLRRQEDNAGLIDVHWIQRKYVLL